ncbi:DUF4198 domain-containing protein [Aurantivibrio infirmus]
MNIKKFLNTFSKQGLLVGVLLALPLVGSAHSRWIIASHTIVSGENPVYVSLDFSISNDIFHVDMSLGGNNLVALTEPELLQRKKELEQFPQPKVLLTYPDGTQDDTTPIVNLERKSASAIKLSQSGTYRINILQEPVEITLFETEDGKHGRQFGSLAAVQARLPKNVKHITEMTVHNRVETYITRNELSRDTLKLSNKGLELKFDSHPNENFAGETSKFYLMLNGKPAPENTVVRLTRNDTRYRNNRNSIEIKSTVNGEIAINWQEAGMYLLETEVETTPDKNNKSKVEVFALYLTLEVNPE